MPLGMRWSAWPIWAATATTVMLLAGCSGSGSPSPTVSASADPLSAAIAAELNRYTTDDHIRSIIVDVDGERRFEKYYATSADQYRPVFSVTKSVMSTLIGIAVGEGKLNLDDRLANLLPTYADQMTPDVAKVTLRQLLTMSAGFPDTFNDSADQLGRSPDWVSYAIDNQSSAPGKAWHYSDSGAHLLSPILEQATGQSALEYGRAKLFDPLGIVTRPGFEPMENAANADDTALLKQYLDSGFAWPVDPQGFQTGATDLKLRPRDMVSLGQLFLQSGRWEDQQLVPADWVRQATSGQLPQDSELVPNAGAFDPHNYGYLWWVETVDGVPAYFALGLAGQRIEVVPQRKVVVVISSDRDWFVPNAPQLGPDDTQRLVDLIVPLAS